MINFVKSFALKRSAGLGVLKSAGLMFKVMLLYPKYLGGLNIWIPLLQTKRSCVSLPMPTEKKTGNVGGLTLFSSGTGRSHDYFRKSLDWFILS